MKEMVEHLPCGPACEESYASMDWVDKYMMDMDTLWGCRYFTKENCCQNLNKLIWISVSIVFMENKRESYFSEFGKENKIERLEIVHTDVWGPTQVSSLGGSLYYVTFIDDANRKTWVYFI
jgi:hypothetical protein